MAGGPRPAVGLTRAWRMALPNPHQRPLAVPRLESRGSENDVSPGMAGAPSTGNHCSADPFPWAGARALPNPPSGPQAGLTLWAAPGFSPGQLQPTVKETPYANARCHQMARFSRRAPAQKLGSTWLAAVVSWLQSGQGAACEDRDRPHPVNDDIAGFAKAGAGRAAGQAKRSSNGIPTFHLNGNLMHLAAHAHHVGFYPDASGMARFSRQLAARCSLALERRTG